jgi:hypothetical protein
MSAVAVGSTNSNIGGTELSPKALAMQTVLTSCTGNQATKEKVVDLRIHGGFAWKATFPQNSGPVVIIKTARRNS